MDRKNNGKKNKRNKRNDEQVRDRGRRDDIEVLWRRIYIEE